MPPGIGEFVIDGDDLKRTDALIRQIETGKQHTDSVLLVTATDWNGLPVQYEEPFDGLNAITTLSLLSIPRNTPDKPSIQFLLTETVTYPTSTVSKFLPLLSKLAPFCRMTLCNNQESLQRLHALYAPWINAGLLQAGPLPVMLDMRKLCIRDATLDLAARKSMTDSALFNFLVCKGTDTGKFTVSSQYVQAYREAAERGSEKLDASTEEYKCLFSSGWNNNTILLRDDSSTLGHVAMIKTAYIQLGLCRA